MYEGLRKTVRNSRLLSSVARTSYKIFWWAFHAKIIKARSKTIEAYMQSHQVKKLNLGAGLNFLDGWLNTDKFPKSPQIAYLNATEIFPFETESFDYIYTEHLIEHLTYDEGMSMLRECLRILKHGGKMRIATPDLKRIISLCVGDKDNVQRRYIKNAMSKYFPNEDTSGECFVINNFFYNWGHKFIYDFDTLKYSLEKVGFTGATRLEL